MLQGGTGVETPVFSIYNRICDSKFHNVKQQSNGLQSLHPRVQTPIFSNLARALFSNSKLIVLAM